MSEAPPISELVAPHSYRERVLGVLQGAARPMCGREVAACAGLPYKTTIDALNALFNHGKVARNGRKFMAMWVRLPDPEPVDEQPFAVLGAALRAWRQLT